jgi:DNA-binding SARP family transcriptional activator
MDAHLEGGLEPCAARVVLSTKLKPGLAQAGEVSARLRELLQPRPGCILLVHASAGYGKTTALAATQEPDWIWYNLDRADSSPLTLASRLCLVLGIEPPAATAQPVGDALAAELADRLAGRAVTVTFDRYQQLGSAPEVGRLLSELLVLVPTLGIRIATRTRPALPLERLRLQGCLFEVGPAELRMEREAVERLLATAFARPPSPEELRFADEVLGGWPAAIVLWQSSLQGDADLMGPLQPFQPLHDYLHEEVFRDALPLEVIDELNVDSSWLPGPGPLLARATTPERRWVVDHLVKNRVGVLPGPDGWCLHPLADRFAALHVSSARLNGKIAHVEVSENGTEPHAAPHLVSSNVVIRTLGGLTVAVDEVPVDDAAWPTAARRLLELLLCLPGYQTTAQQAARLLWPRHLLRSAVNSFNVALHGLRRVLEPQLTAGAESRYVVRQGRTYRLCLERMTCDAEDFSRLVRQVPAPLGEAGAHQLESAVELYRGDFLAASSEEFVLDKRARLRRSMVDALERLGEWHSSAGSVGLALRVYNRMLEFGPHREDVWARILELYLSTGDEYQALAALQRCQQTLHAAGIEPSGLLRELHRRIRRDASLQVT